MPNWSGGNTKAIEARENKKASKAAKASEEAKRKQDLLWKDDVTEAKLSKKEELAAKQTEKLQRKAELRKLAAEEEARLASSKQSKQAPTKLTLAQIQQRALLATLEAAKKKQMENEPEDILVENPNRVLAEEKQRAEAAGQEYIAASTVSEYLEAVDSLPVDRAPERRMRAAHAAYEEEWLPRLKAEFPSLKRSQLKDKIWKQWLKAPENPMNQLPPKP